MTDRDLVAVLERAVSAVSPRDPDPVGAVIRRVRARRRRVIAGSAAVVLLAAGAGLAGVLATGQGSVRTSPPATGKDAGPVRQVTPWSGPTTTLRGVTVPVPDGWQVEDAAPTTPGMPCRGRPADRTVFLGALRCRLDAVRPDRRVLRRGRRRPPGVPRRRAWRPLS